MVTRVLELIARPGASDALCDAIDEDVRGILREVPGFLELVTLVSEGEARLIVLLTVWRSRSAASHYEREIYPQILERLQPFLESHPHERAFQFAHDGRPAPSTLKSDKEHSID
jgi:quinol monooxygenase YgiN